MLFHRFSRDPLARRLQRVLLIEIALIVVFYLALFTVITSIVAKQNHATTVTLQRFQMALDVQTLHRLLFEHDVLEKTYQAGPSTARYDRLLKSHNDYAKTIHTLETQLGAAQEETLVEASQERTYAAELDESHAQIIYLLNKQLDKPLSLEATKHHSIASDIATITSASDTETKLGEITTRSIATVAKWETLIKQDIQRLQTSVEKLQLLRTVAMSIQAFFVVAVLLVVAYLYVLPSFNDILQKLVAKNKQLQEFDTLKTEFLSIASHQLRTPLSELKWTLTLLERERKNKLTDKEQSMLKKAGESLNVMVKLVARLLNVTRIEEGRLILNREPTDLVGIIRSACEDATWHAKDSLVSVEYRLSHKQAIANADPVLIREVIQNLIDNAIKYNKPGGRVLITLASQRKSWHIEVRDTGVGLKPTEMKHLFTKFYRGEEARRIKPDGSGLGLYFIKKIIEKHNGTISIESTWQKGTTVSVVVPSS